MISGGNNFRHKLNFINENSQTKGIKDTTKQDST